MSTVFENYGVLLGGFAWTLALIALSTVLALIGGTILATMRVCPIPLLQKISSGYIDIFRNVPTAVIFFFTLFVLPQVDIRISFFASAVTALSVYYSAFFCEAIRSGINAIPGGQAEAARSVGLTFGKSLQLVILPQALRTVIPPLINVFIALTKSSAIASAFGVVELLASAEQLIAVDSQDVMAILGVVALLYLAITIPAGLLAHHFEHKLAVQR
jgi:glutamate transport system permease protein